MSDAPLLSDDLAAALRAEITAAMTACVGEPLTEMRRFIDRRFAELSAEIHATATMAEMSEATLVEQINRIQHEVARMVSAPISETRTSGLELEAVVQTTEVAANQILEAAEAILDWAAKGNVSEVETEIGLKVQAIFEACSFQDLTSQRIRRAIRHLEQVDTMLNNIVSHDPAPDQPAEPPPGTSPGGTGADLQQDLIDQLLNF